MEYAEIYPTSGKKLKPFDTIITDRTRTIELWKEPKSEQVRIILGSAKGDMKFFTNSLNVSNYKILEQHEPKDRPEKTTPESFHTCLLTHALAVLISSFRAHV